MAYIGKEPAVGNFQVCDAISVVNGQAAYTMQVSSTNVVPESANHMLVSLNGILQKPNSSFTVSGSTITFASNLATGDVIDFIMLLGNVLDIGTPSDSTVTDAKTNFVTTSSAAGLQIKGDGTTAGAISLNCEQNSHGIKLQSPPHSANQSYTLKFPSGNVTAGKFLKVDSVSGSGTTGVGTMTFADAGGFVLLSSTTISGTPSSIAFDNSLITSTYDNYVIIGSSLEPTADLSLGVGLSVDNGSNGTAQQYNNSRYLQLSANTQGFNSTTVTVNSASGPLIAELNDGKLGSFVLQIFNTQATVRGTMVRYESIYENASGTPYSLLGATIFSNTSAINHIQIATSTSTFQSGFVQLYGLAK